MVALIRSMCCSTYGQPHVVALVCHVVAMICVVIIKDTPAANQKWQNMSSMLTALIKFAF